MKNALLLAAVLFSINALAHTECKSCVSSPVFIQNKGQWGSQPLFKVEMPNAYTYFCKNNITYLLADTGDMNRLRHDLHRYYDYQPQINPVVHLHAFRATFVNANMNAVVNGEEKIKEYFNYYLGKDPKRWASHVNGFQKIVYQNIYSNIDLLAYSDGANLKYDFVVKKNTSASAIKILYEGAEGVKIENGELRIKTSVGDVVEMKPYAYQLVNGKRKEVKCLFELNEQTVSFNFPEGYDKNNDLVIDPTLIFSTYSGSVADNFGYSATYDSKGEVYAAGSVFHFGTDTFPTTLGAFQTLWAGGVGYSNPGNQSGTGTDIGITKYDSAGTVRIYSTLLGGNGDDLPHSLVVNKNDELFVFGTTGSNNFPVTNGAYDISFNGGINPGVFGGLAVHYSAGSDIIITRFNQNGTALVASTYVGGTGNDGLTYPEYSGLHYNYADEVRGEIDIDQNNNVFVATCTRSTDFPTTPGAYKATSSGLMEGVVFKMDNNLTQMVWSTYLGGNDDDAIFSVAFDANEDLYLTGGTQSSNFPVTAGTIQTTIGGGRADGFIAHLSKNGSQLLHSTFYGSNKYDQIYFVETSKQGNVYVLGQTEAGGNRFIYNAAYNTPGGGQFISKLKPTLDSLIWSTAFGRGDSTPDISPTAFLVDVCNKMYVSGWGSYPLVGDPNEPRLTTTGLYVTNDAYQSTTDGNDFYVMVLEDDASAVSYATYFGSSVSEEHVDGGTSRFDRKGIMYQSVCAGCGGNDSFPTTPNAVSRINGSYNCNNAVFKFDLQLPLIAADFNPPATVCGTPATLSFTNTSKAFLSSTYVWNFGDNSTTSTQTSPSHTYNQSGTFTVTLVINDPTACNLTDTIRKQITILQNGGTDTLPPVNLCYGQSAQIGLPAGADTFATYQWTPVTNLSATNIGNPVASPLTTTTYNLAVTFGICSANYVQTVNVVEDTINASANTVLCAGDTLRLNVTHTNATVPLTYSWVPSPPIVYGANTANPVALPTQPTTFIVTATNSVGCVYTDSVTSNIISSLPNVNAVAVPDTIYWGDTSQLNLTLSANVTAFDWQPDPTLSATDIVDPLAYPKKTNAYYVEVSDSNGCRKTDTVIVVVLLAPCKEANLYIPNAFSPNGDGKNDVLFVRGNYITKLYFAVYDRWGQKMFETKDITRGWDGTFKGKKIDPAVFGYYLEGECEGGDKFFKKGNVTLLK